jgi:hypothetical protein
MPVTAASTVNVDRVSWINGTNMLLVYLLLLASEVGQLVLFWQLLGVLLPSGFHESDLILSSVNNWYCRIYSSHFFTCFAYSLVFVRIIGSSWDNSLYLYLKKYSPLSSSSVVTN